MSIMDIYGVDPYTGPGGIDAALPDFDLSIPPGIPGMTAPAINFRDAPVNFMMRQNNPRVFDPMVNVKNFVQSFPTNLRSGITKGLDFGKTIGSGIISLATGIPFAGDVLSGITSQFENRPLGAPVIDEFGNVYDPEELNKLNALGGYYTDPARSARRRSKRIARMLEKQKLGKKISLQNLAKLQAQERAQEKAQRAAIDAMFARGEGGSGQDFTGGRFDRAGSRGEYDANPTGFSGSS
tara:strand:+ start:105 stop:821 length:717 start_codon:yes stop_codon:yes gene_type:complete